MKLLLQGLTLLNPHHHPTDRRIRDGELLKIDFGALYKGFSADITRTVILGRQNVSDKPEQEKILEIVKEACSFRDARLLSQALKLQILTKFVEITFKIKVMDHILFTQQAMD